MTHGDDVKEIAFGYYVLGFVLSGEGMNGEIPPDDVLLREAFEREWSEVERETQAGRRLWTVYNGWRGNGLTAAIVEAPDEAAAVEAAITVLRDSPDGRTHGEKFYDREHLRPEPLGIPCVTELG